MKQQPEIKSKNQKQPNLFSEHQWENAYYDCAKHEPIVYPRKKILISWFNDIVYLLSYSHSENFACKITQNKAESSKNLQKNIKEKGFILKCPLFCLPLH